MIDYLKKDFFCSKKQNFMRNNIFSINCTNPLDYLNNLHELGNKKQKLWNGYEIVTNMPNVKANCQIFIKNDLHFYRTDYLVSDAFTLKINKETKDAEYIDFRINKSGERASMIKEKELQMRPVQKKDISFHVFLKKEIIGLSKEVLQTKRDMAHLYPKINKLSAEILAIPATGNKNALRLEGKMLELSYAYLEFLHAPLTQTPSFLNCDYKCRCILDAKEILEKTFNNPPTIKCLSKKVGINCNQLKIGFKHLYKTTIRQFVIDLRLERARQMVLNTRRPLSEICHKIGYTNHGHFSNLYKAKFGLSPMQDRKSSHLDV